MTCASWAASRAPSWAPLDLAGLQMLVDRNRRHQEYDQHHSDGRCNRPVLVGKEFRPQSLADHGGIGAAEQIRNDELADDRDEAQKGPGPEARQRKGYGDDEECLPARATEIAGGFKQ